MKKLSALLLCLALLLSLAACTPSQAQAAVVRYGLSNGWDSLMPYNSVSGSNYSRIIYDKIYDRLAYVHADGTLDPRAAVSWESANDGYSVLFHLNENAAFHDGVPVTAEHWEATIRLMTDPACPAVGRSVFGVLAGTDEAGAATGEPLGVQAVDQYTLMLTFKVPTTPEDFLLDKNREFYVLPTHLIGDASAADVLTLDLWDAPVGSGPCKFVSETAGSQLTLQVNPDYQLGRPEFDMLVISVVDKSNLLTSLIAGDLDYYAFGGSVTAEDAQTARDAGLTVLEGTVPNTFFELMLNNETVSQFVRLAIDLALDKQALCLQATQGLGEAAVTDLTPGTGYASLVTWSWERDLDRARSLLSEEGYDGRTYTLACTSNRAGLAALMQMELAEVGINVVIQTVDSAAMFAGMASGTYDMGIASHTPGNSPLWFTESRFSEGNNIFHVDDLSPYASYINQIQTETDADARGALVTEFQEVLAVQRPFIPLWFGRALHVQSPTVEGIDYPSSSFCNENIWEWRLLSSADS